MRRCWSLQMCPLLQSQQKRLHCGGAGAARWVRQWRSVPNMLFVTSPAFYSSMAPLLHSTSTLSYILCNWSGRFTGVYSTAELLISSNLGMRLNAPSKTADRDLKTNFFKEYFNVWHTSIIIWLIWLDKNRLKYSQIAFNSMHLHVSNLS